MATTSCSHDHEEDEEEYLLLNLDGVFEQVDIPPNAPYVLSGLDTLNPVLIIDNKLKLVGEYEETIGTCFVFSESAGVCRHCGDRIKSICVANHGSINHSSPVVHDEPGPSEANFFSGKSVGDPKLTPTKQVKPIARLHKILKFRLLLETEIEDSTTKETTTQL